MQADGQKIHLDAFYGRCVKLFNVAYHDQVFIPTGLVEVYISGILHYPFFLFHVSMSLFAIFPTAFDGKNTAYFRYTMFYLQNNRFFSGLYSHNQRSCSEMECSMFPKLP